VAVALPDNVIVSCTGVETWVTLSGNNSYDLDECELLDFRWDPAEALVSPEQPLSGGWFRLGYHMFTLAVMDQSGDWDLDGASFSVVDNEAPMLDCRDQVAECTHPQGTVVAQTTSAVDTCDPEAELVGVAPATFPLGVTELQWTATDTSGNTASCTSTTTVVDTHPPWLNGPIAAATECAGPAGTSVELGWSAFDHCDPAPQAANDAPVLFPVGETVVSWALSDASGNVRERQTTVTVADTTTPTITCSDELLEGLDPAGAPFEPWAPVSDVCDPVPTLVHDGPAVFSLGSTLVHLTGSDASGNSAMCRSVVTVVDSSAPVVGCGDATAECVGPQGTPVAVAASVSDTCDPNAPLNSDAPALFPLGATEVQLSSTDASGNTGTCSATVTVADTTPPELLCPPPITVVAGTGGPTGPALVAGPLAGVGSEPKPTCTGYADPQATATDGCDDAPQVLRKPSRTSWPLGTRPVDFTAIDASGNAATCTTTVTVVDETPPDVHCNASDPAVSDLPVVFAATGGDVCGLELVEVVTARCFRQTPGGGEVQLNDKACKVSVERDRIRLSKGLSPGTRVEWAVRALDGSGN